MTRRMSSVRIGIAADPLSLSACGRRSSEVGACRRRPSRGGSGSARDTSHPLSRCVLRATGGPVDLERYALREGPRVDQVKRDVRAGVGEEPRALADDHWDDEQVDLVDELVVE